MIDSEKTIIHYDVMVRTQIYLTEAEDLAVTRLSGASSMGKSGLIRQAIDEFIVRRSAGNRLKKLRAARGMWRNRRDVPDVRALRENFDRF